MFFILEFELSLNDAIRGEIATMFATTFSYSPPFTTPVNTSKIEFIFIYTQLTTRTGSSP